MLVAHAGLSKTGTSIIQHALYKLSQNTEVSRLNYPDISGSGFGFYAETGTTSGNANLKRDFAEWNGLDTSKRWDYALNTAVSRAHGKNTVLSSENLAENVTADWFWSLLAERREHNPIVAIYFRSPFSHFVSCYVTRVKFGFRGSLEEFVDEYLTSDQLHSFHVYRNLERVLQFSRQYAVPIIVGHYEKVKSRLLSHFLNDVCDLRVGQGLLDALGVMSVNQRLSMHQVEFQRGINVESLKLGRLLGWESTAITRQLRPSGEHPHSSELELSLQARARLAEEFGELKSQLPDLASELADLDCEVDHRDCSETLSPEERAVRLRSRCSL